MPRDRRVKLLLTVFDQAFGGASWHGTPLGGALRGVSPRQALWRPGRGRHNIWELVLHTAYWKNMVRRRLTRDDTVAFPRPGANFPALPSGPGAAQWRRDVALLRREHGLLRRAIARLAPAALERRVWQSRWNAAATVVGIASHDLYHAGQIQLLKRLQRGAT
jgi:DinB family protein